MYYSVDRVEGAIAVLEDEDGNLSHVPLASLPEGVKETDVLSFQDGAWEPALDEAARRRERILRLQQMLRKQ